MATRVLMVGDDAALSEAVSSLLRQDGFDVEVAHSGEPVLDVIGRNHPDVLILDLSPADSYGLAVARAVREVWPELPIILSTAGDPKGGLLDTLSRLHVSILREPYEIASLVRQIQNSSQQ